MQYRIRLFKARILSLSIGHAEIIVTWSILIKLKYVVNLGCLIKVSLFYLIYHYLGKNTIWILI